MKTWESQNALQELPAKRGPEGCSVVNAAEFQKREKSLLAGVTKEVSTDETGLRRNPKGGWTLPSGETNMNQ